MRRKTVDQKIFGELRIFSDVSKRPIQTDDIYIYVVDLPVNEAVRPCGAYGYTVYLNAKLSEEGRRRALEHALMHINKGDFEKHDVQSIEAETHQKGD